MDKVKGFDETDVFPSGDVEARRIWPEFTGPSGFRLAANHIVRRLRPMNHIGLATFRVDCLAIRETELALYRQNLL